MKEDADDLEEDEDDTEHELQNAEDFGSTAGESWPDCARRGCVEVPHVGVVALGGHHLPGIRW